MGHFLATLVVLLLFHTGCVLTDCPSSCTSCVDSRCENCEPSHYLADNNCHPCPENCLSCTDQTNCTECIANKWGAGVSQCLTDCSKDCRNVECHDATGHCLNCEDGKYGHRCQFNCSLCKNDSCDLYRCVGGCKAGYFEYQTFNDYFCQKCPKNCTLCDDGNVCRKCNDGFYFNEYYYNGNTYINCVPCLNGNECLNHCLIQGCNLCQLVNNKPRCADCPEGEAFNGDSCEQNATKCSQTCSTNCDSNDICLGNCSDGWTGERCIEICNEKCSICSKNDRNICIQCKGDFNSTDCSLACSQSCKTEEEETSIAQTSSIQTVTEGPEEKQQITEESKIKEENNDIIIIGASTGGGFLVLILIIVFGLCLLKRRRKSSGDNSAQHEEAVAENQIQDLYAQPIKKPALNPESQDYIYAQPNKLQKLKETRTREIGKPKTKYDNVTIDLDDETAVSSNSYANVSIDIKADRVSQEETDVDEIVLEELDEGSSKLIETEVNPPSADLYYNTASLVRSRIQVSDLLEYVMKKTDYEDEFEKLPKGLTRTCDEALTRNNRKKNRYNGVYAYDATRVVLQSKTYINANYIDGHKDSPEYIASLGPTKVTMNGYKDFWEMIWHERTDRIIMLTNLDESGKMKCEQYWPDQGKTQNYQGYKVVCNAEKTFSEFTVREFSVSVQRSEPRKVTQYHYTAWPDRSVPDNVASLIEFRNKVEQTKSKDAGPMVVHCSAGIGRTGTYIALDTLIQEGMNDNYVDIFGRVMALRGQRGHMVQNLEQYIFLHRCLLYALTCDPDPLPVTEIPRIMTDSKISHQFQTFTEVVILNTSARKSSAQKKIRKENRKGADIPGDEYRVRLNSTKHEYINAVYVNGYENPYKFIVTQTPMPNTDEDFICMIYQEKCACIVDLDEVNFNDKSVGHYLPQDGKVSKVGHFQVACKNVETLEHFIIRDLTISRTGLHLSGELHLKHYQYNGWSHSEKVPPREEQFLQFVKIVENEAKGQSEERTIVVHCLTGAERSCLFCAVSIISEKCFFEKEISVLDTICQLRSRRKTALSDLEQFRFCYQAVNTISETSGKKQYYNMIQLL